MPICKKCDKFMKSGYKQVKTRKFGINLKMKWTCGGLTPPDTWYDEISYECKGGCDNGAGGVWVDEEEQPPSPDDGTADYDIDEQLAKEKETEVVKIFATEINDSIMKDPEVCILIAKNHILEMIFDEILTSCNVRVDSKYYLDLCQGIHKL